MIDKVLCLVETQYTEIDEQLLWMDLEDNVITRTEKITPLIDHLHNDKENGQEDVHYHIDTRYLETLSIHSNEIRVFPKRLLVNQKLEYRALERKTDDYRFVTPVGMISKSNLKHKCIYKGKCPHRGMDLTGIKPINGIITCPLHSLRFDSKTKNLIEE